MSNEVIWIIPFFLSVVLIVGLVKGYIEYSKNNPNLVDEEALKALPEPLVLIKRISNITDKELKKIKQYYLLGVLFIAILILFPILLILNSNEKLDVDLALYQLLVDRPDPIIMTIIFIAVVYIFPIYIKYSRKNERLTLTKQGIAFSPSGIRLVDYFMPAWSIAWADIKKIKFENTLTQGRLSLSPVVGKARHIMLPQWELDRAPGEKKNRGLFSAMYIKRQWQSNVFIRNTPVVRYIQDIVGISLGLDKGNGQFDLFSDAPARNVTLIIFVLLLYSIIDFMANMEVYLVSPPWWIFVLFGALAFVLSLLYIAKGKADIGIRIVLALLMGVVAVISSYPGMLRINQLSDFHGLSEYHYVMAYDGVFKSHDKTMPDIKMEHNDYWASMETGQKQSFLIRKGGLEFYQLDMDDVYKHMRQWYCIKNKQKKCF